MNPQPDVRPSSPPAVVTGAGGWLGQNLVRELARQGRRVRALVQHAEEGPLLEVVGPHVTALTGDVRDPGAVERLLEDASGAAVFHGAGVIHPAGSTRAFFDVNVGGTEVVLDSARRARVGRFVHISSNSPFGANPGPEDRFDETSPFNPYMGYGQSKLMAEDLVRGYGERGDLAATILRPPWFYGPFQPPRQAQFFSAIRKGRFPLVGDGDQRRSMVYTGNLVQGCLRAEAADRAIGQEYWIADAEPYRLADIFEGVRAALRAEGLEVTDRRPPRVPAFVAGAVVRADAALQALGRYVQPVHVLGELRDTIACDITKAREEIGYDPQVSLVEGMRASIRWARERGQQL